MNKNLEELKKIEDKIFKTDIKKLNEKALTYMMERIVHCLILVLEGFVLILEGFEKRLKKIESWINNCYKINGEFKELKVGKASPGANFEKRLKVVEAELGIYTDEEIKEVKLGGTDPN